MSSEQKKSFISKYIFSLDHKVIGKQYFFTALFMGIIGGMLAMLIRLQLGWPGVKFPLLGKILPGMYEEGLLKPEYYVALFTMHGTIMVFFVLSLASVSGFGNYILPLQIGAKDLASPLLNMLSFWTLVPGCIILLISFFVTGGPAASGWTAYPPLSAVKGTIPGSQTGQTLWIIAMAFFIASFTMGGLNFVTTVLALRTKGLTFFRLPLFTWAIFLVSILGLLSFPPLLAGAILLLFDRHFGTSFYLPEGLVIGDKLLPTKGGSPLLWQHLFWFLGHPEVYVLMLPSLAIAADIIAVFSRKPIFGYKVVVWCMILIVVLSLLAWGHHMYISGMNPYLGAFFATSTLMITFPSALIVIHLLATLWKAKMIFKTAHLFALAIVSLFITGGLGGLFLASPAVDIQLHDTYFVVGHFHLILAGAAIFGVFAGTYYWFPKMFGTFMSETLGKIHFWLTFIAYYATFFPMHFLGAGGMHRRIYDPTVYDYLKKFKALNIHISVWAFILGFAQLIFLFNFFWSIFKGKKADNNPWRANTLEWQTQTPVPPEHNWDGALPVVYRGPYEYSVPGSLQDYLPQNTPTSQ